jgi:radical SAM superfamily enzyme YgiQ (UPF0313 family)
VRAFEIAAGYRRRGVPVVMGGIHPTSCPDDVLPHADAVAVGEGEELWPEILRDAAAGRLRRLYRAERPADLARSPVPRWELIGGKNYLFTNTLCVSRGCPWRCGFCYQSAPAFRSGWRMKPTASILAEVESLGTGHVMFVDDNLLGRPRETRRMLEAIRPLGLVWQGAVSADVGGHEDLLDLMAASGCRSLFIGFETVNPESLAECGKSQNRIETYERTIAAIHARGIMVNASIVFGFDADRPDVFRRTVDWLAAQRVETMTAHILTPYPGTPLHARLLADGRIVDFDLRHYNTSRAVFRPRHMSPDELEAGYRGAYESFYSFKCICERIPEAAGQRTAYLLFNLFYRKYGRYVSLLGRAGLMGPLGRLARALAYPQGLGRRREEAARCAPEWS